jgi:HAD superfamily hydrolase (TIGR01509 family)
LSRKERCIKAVTFDLWETLLLESDGANSRRLDYRCKSLQGALAKHGVRLSLNQLESALNKTTLSLLDVWKTNKDVKHEDQIRAIIESTSNGSIRLEDQWLEDLISAYTAPLFAVPPYLNPDAPELLQQLKSREISTGLICNTGLTPGVGLRSFLEKENVAQYFELMIFSEEIGIRKPDARIFHLAAKTLGVNPRNAVHVGDDLYTDIWGAQNAGFKAILFRSEIGRDRFAESDPLSLLSLSRKPGRLERSKTTADKTVTSLGMVMNAINEMM